MQSIFMHVGLPKTGTTAFQQLMDARRAQLLRAGLSYPGGEFVVDAKHQFLVGGLCSGNLSRFRALLNQIDTSITLLSAEGLSNHLDDFRVDALSEFRESLDGFRVELIVVTREQQSWLRSYHGQCVLNPLGHANPLWGTALGLSEIRHHPRVQRLLDCDVLCDDLGQAFGASTVHRFDYDGPWMSGIFGLLGVDGLESDTAPQANRSLPAWCIEWIRRMNLLEWSLDRQEWWRQRLRQYVESTVPGISMISHHRVPVGRDIQREASLLLGIDEWVDHAAGMEVRSFVTRSLDETGLSGGSRSS
ncbi:MAG TPA: hypothetical protein P5171_00455 [Xanthomonadaceae bacterium]|nr:hypothetical protein [Xanthomonadaceae bacterium]HRX98571.1 hypothetical protein [Xanthomonadaceae bacterium]